MLNLAQDIKPISYVKAHTAEILKHIEKKKNPVVITQNGEAKAVLLDITTYQSLVDSVTLMKIISIGESQVASGKTLSNKEVDKKVKELLKLNNILWTEDAAEDLYEIISYQRMKYGL